MAIHLPLNFMLLYFVLFCVFCFVLSCLFYLPAAVSVSNLAVMSPITGHDAPVLPHFHFTHSLNSAISVDVVLAACVVTISSVHKSSGRATGLAIS